MSEEQLKAFIAKVQTDTALQEQLKAEDADPVIIAQSAGFTITNEDLNAVKAQQTLSDEELENVSGGTIGTILFGVTAFGLALAGPQTAAGHSSTGGGWVSC